MARERPEELIESGPAGGVAAAQLPQRAHRRAEPDHHRRGRHELRRLPARGRRGPGHRRVRDRVGHARSITPMLDIRTIGAGGGSIAWIDDGGSLRVGPQSAGADPGPACYGRGGDAADGHRREPRARPHRPDARRQARSSTSTPPSAAMRTRRRAARAGRAATAPRGSSEIVSENMAAGDPDGLDRPRPRPARPRARRLRRRRRLHAYADRAVGRHRARPRAAASPASPRAFGAIDDGRPPRRRGDVLHAVRGRRPRRAQRRVRRPRARGDHAARAARASPPRTSRSIARPRCATSGSPTRSHAQSRPGRSTSRRSSRSQRTSTTSTSASTAWRPTELADRVRQPARHRASGAREAGRLDEPAPTARARQRRRAQGGDRRVYFDGEFVDDAPVHDGARPRPGSESSGPAIIEYADSRDRRAAAVTARADGRGTSSWAQALV